MEEWKKIHMVGIKGVGMTALAQLLAQRGVSVRGSDVEETFMTDVTLAKEGITVLPFDATNIDATLDVVIYSTAYQLSQVELARAVELGIPLMTYPEALAQVFNESYGIAVTGSHGKTTTSALLTYVLSRLELDPTAIVGATMLNFGASALTGQSGLMVIEADEYQNKLAQYGALMAIVTNIDYDHPDFFKTREEYDAVFREFIKKTIAGDRKTVSHRGLVVVCGDDTGVRRVIDKEFVETYNPSGADGDQQRGRIVAYGFDDICDYQLLDYRGLGGMTYFSLWRTHKDGLRVEREHKGDYAVPLVGRHNALNAAAVIVLCLEQEYGSPASIAQALRDFKGTARRFEHKGVAGSHTVVIDDYAHHPAEIVATLGAAREHYPDKKIWAVFAGHTYSRTEALLLEFATSFGVVDHVVVLDIYGSAREPVGTMTGQDVVDAINAQSGNAEYIPTIEEAVESLSGRLSDIDVLITVGAGDVWRVGSALVMKN